ncbi:hypothetical protein HK098_000940 [Nowakowskiella sp. JEL0407]|nr:hypothetical protein HK098_000940 [Nowakowskiella sp. JEL0407]
MAATKKKIWKLSDFNLRGRKESTSGLSKFKDDDVPVYQIKCQDVVIMRRKDNSYINITQLLTAKGMRRGRVREKCIEFVKMRELWMCVEIEVWFVAESGEDNELLVPITSAVKIAKELQVYRLIKPLVEYVPSPTPNIDTNSPSVITSVTPPPVISTQYPTDIEPNVAEPYIEFKLSKGREDELIRFLNTLREHRIREEQLKKINSDLYS